MYTSPAYPPHTILRSLFATRVSVTPMLLTTPTPYLSSSTILSLFQS